ncbi:MAG: hypothetical protein NZM31_02760 [Gemmatales bacterium]|nr:hypothetical protein [Gemmatales bacterium]MDW8385921.1 hypothetical protein [Gemmatales bacterium]
MHAKTTGKKPNYQPTLEALENRLAPAVSVTVLPNNTLIIRGDSADDHVQVTDDGYGHVTVQAGDFIGDYSGISKIRVRLRGGDDTFTYNRVEMFYPMIYPGPVAVPTNLKVHLGQGNDTASFTLTEGMGNARAKILVHGFTGDDSVTLQLGEMYRGRFRFIAALGDGDDSFEGSLNGALSGRSRVAVAVLGMNGNNHINMETHADLDPRARLGIFLVGGSGTDEIFARYTGVNQGMVGLWISGEDGNDTATAEYLFSDGSTGVAALGSFGGPGDDQMSMIVHGDTGLSTKIFTLDGGDGNDTGVTTPNVDVFNVEDPQPAP